MKNKNILFAMMVLCLTSFELFASTDEQWLNDDSEFQALEVNEGDLVFLASAPKKKPLHSSIELNISERSFKTGWVSFNQCFEQLDQFSKMEVQYRYRDFRQLKIVSQQNIQKATVQGKIIQLRHVGKNAKLCVRGEMKNLQHKVIDSKSIFEITQGPYHRRFLDGFYPYHLSLVINYPSEQLQFSALNHSPQPGFQVQENPGRVEIDAIFEGVLILAARFNARNKISTNGE